MNLPLQNISKEALRRLHNSMKIIEPNVSGFKK
jgi:hypothetical protein